MFKPMIRRVRRNHALEHATVAMLLEEGIRPPLAGYSTLGGFFILARVSVDTLTSAANEAMERLKGGESELAISRFCGTNLLTGAMLSGVLSALIMGRGKRRARRIPVAAAAIVCATLVARPLGNALQRHYTTLSDIGGLQITGVKRVWAARRYAVHRVNTRIT